MHRAWCENLGQVILDDIADNAVLVKVSASTISANLLLEGDLHVVNVVSVPHAGENCVGKAKDQHVLQKT